MLILPINPIVKLTINLTIRLTLLNQQLIIDPLFPPSPMTPGDVNEMSRELVAMQEEIERLETEQNRYINRVQSGE